LHATLAILIDRLDNAAGSRAPMIPWSAPVPAFGDPARSWVATVGLNPSNREFVDDKGRELEGTERRFHTLESLGLTAWSELDTRHLASIQASCEGYFQGNPYDRWFQVLESVIGRVGASYYKTRGGACHLDLVPYATEGKWTELSIGDRRMLLSLSGDTVGRLVAESGARWFRNFRG
jgi:hypothetical protein